MSNKNEFNQDTPTKKVSTTPTDKISVLYGDTQLILDAHHSKIIIAGTKNQKYSQHFTHQSAFIRTEVMKKYHYDTSFKIAADADFFTKIYNLGYKFQKIDAIIATYDANGISGSLSWRLFVEFCSIGYKYNKLYPIALTIRYLYYNLPRAILRNLLPKKYRNFARAKFGAKKQ